MCCMRAGKVGAGAWLGKVTGEIPERKLKEFEKEFEKRGAGAVARASDADEAREGFRGGVAESGGVVQVGGGGEEGGGDAGAVSSRGERFKRLRRAGFAVETVGVGEGVGEGAGEGLRRVAGPGRGAERALGSGVAARSRGGGRVVSGFGEERVEDVRALEEQRDEEACDRQRHRMEEGTRGRMVDLEGRALERNEGGAFSLRK